MPTLELRTAEETRNQQVVNNLFGAGNSAELRSKFIDLADTPYTLTIIDSSMYGLSGYNFENILSFFASTNGLTGNITKLQLGSGVTSIGSDAFAYCTVLYDSLVLPSGLTSIGSNAFAHCTVLYDSLVLPSGLTSIGSTAFYNCIGFTGLLVIPEGVTSIGQLAFYNCVGITSLTLPNSLTTISNYAFQYCYELANITLPNACTSIGTDAFRGCPITSINLPSTLTQIRTGAFRYSGLTSVRLPSSLVADYEVRSRSFGDCPNLTTVYAECNATAVNSLAFSVSPVTKIYYRADKTWPATFAGIPTEVWTSYPNPMP